MKIKSIVKVMNFHSLLRVDSAKKKAEKYFEYEKALTDFADQILNNKNLILDKKIVKLNKKSKPLNIYIANDYGFCGNFNSNINRKILEDVESDKIIIGKKVLKKSSNALLKITKDEFFKDTQRIEDILYDSIVNSKNSEVNIIYNHYYNISKMELVKKRILPLESNVDKSDYKYKLDFVVEGDINEILLNIILMYLSYEIIVATENSYASENVSRQMITNQSLKKIADIEQEETRQERKKKNAKSFKKVIENYINLNSNEG